MFQIQFRTFSPFRMAMDPEDPNGSDVREDDFPSIAPVRWSRFSRCIEGVVMGSAPATDPWKNG